MKNDFKKMVKMYSVKDKSVIRLSNTLQKFRFSIVAFSDGLINKEDFLSPCIVLTPINMPKIRLNGEKETLKKYFDKYGKKKVSDFTAKEYTDYLNFAEKAGETKEYIIWRKSSKNIISNLIKKVKEFNYLNKNKFRLSILKFSDGSIRLDFGNQKKDEVRRLCRKLSLSAKKNVLKDMFFQFDLFRCFLSKNLL